MNPFNNKRFKNKDLGLYDNRPIFKEMINYYNNLNQEEQINFNNKIKKQALYYYKYYRSIVSNIIPSTELITILNDNNFLHILLLNYKSNLFSFPHNHLPTAISPTEKINKKSVTRRTLHSFLKTRLIRSC